MNIPDSMENTAITENANAKNGREMKYMALPILLYELDCESILSVIHAL